MRPETRALIKAITRLLGSLAALFFFVMALVRFGGGNEELGLKWLAIGVLAEIANSLELLASQDDKSADE